MVDLSAATVKRQTEELDELIKNPLPIALMPAYDAEHFGQNASVMPCCKKITILAMSSKLVLTIPFLVFERKELTLRLGR